jgi:uncharacterized membrane protein YkvA (DUF1232 family)
MIKNAFFKMALSKAASLLGRKGRMLSLLASFAYKLKDVEWNRLNGQDVKEKFFVIGRLFKAYTLGKYRTIPWKPLLIITAAMIYFVSPIDLIPDVLVGVGFTDDFAILLSVYSAASDELNKFITWEKSQVIES